MPTMAQACQLLALVHGLCSQTKSLLMRIRHLTGWLAWPEAPQFTPTLIAADARHLRSVEPRHDLAYFSHRFK